MKCIITEKINDKGINILKEHMEVVTAYDKSREEILEMLGDFDVLLIRAETQVDQEMIDAGKKLKVIGMNGIGLNHVDVNYAKSKDISVLNVPDGSITAVSELTMTLILSTLRKLYPTVSATKAGHWDKTSFQGNELKGKTVGILALGQIGFKVAELCQAFGMKVIAYDPYQKQEIADKIGVPLLSLEEVLKEADILSIHSPLTKETKHMIGKEQIDMMKDGSFIFNLGRGGIVVEEDLYDALVSGKIKAAAGDVLENEPPTEADMKLIQLDNFMVTCHIGAGTVEAQEYISESLAKQTLAALNIQ